jgi:hypothetical protein
MLLTFLRPLRNFFRLLVNSTKTGRLCGMAFFCYQLVFCDSCQAEEETLIYSISPIKIQTMVALFATTMSKNSYYRYNSKFNTTHVIEKYLLLLNTTPRKTLSPKINLII